MILDKVLILKGLAGVAALGGGVSFCIVGHKNNWWRDRQLTPEEIKTGLGLPTDCNIPTDSNPTCTLNTEKLKKIKFDGKGETDPTITDSGSVTLTITKTSDTDSYPQGYKFSFNPTGEVTISSTPSLKIAKNSNTEFKIKETTAEGGAKTLSLEKAWNVTEWGKKVGLTSCATTGGQKQCDFGGKINLFISDSNKTEEGTIESGKKITFEEDQGGYNQGFKFTVSEDISLNGASDGNKKIESSNGTGNPSYEIKEIKGKWYLAKKESAN